VIDGDAVPRLSRRSLFQPAADSLAVIASGAKQSSSATFSDVPLPGIASLALAMTARDRADTAHSEPSKDFVQ
jgi:hypothetical protein